MMSKLRLLEALMQNSRDGFVTFDLECRFTYWSPAMEKISGLSSMEVLGRNAFVVFPFLKDTGEDHAYYRTLQGEASISKNKNFFVPETGKQGVIEAHYTPLYAESGAVIGGIIVMRDVTEENRVRQEQQETETRFKNMADSSPIMLWMSGTDGLCTFFNQTWLQYTGRTLKQEWGVGWSEGVHPEDFQQCMDTYVENFNSRKPFEMEYRLQRSDGEYRWILDRGSPRYTPEGQFAGYIGSCADIHEIKKLEGELRKNIRAREEFLSIASHELKTPLTALNLQMGILQHTLKKPELFEKSAEKIGTVLNVSQRQLRGLAGLIENLLDVSRIDTGRIVLEKQEFDLVQMVRENIDRQLAAANENQSPIALEADSKVVGHWDIVRVDQVISNLLSNAIKYGSGMPIEVKVSQNGRHAVLQVTDHGIGIAPEQQARIFDKFHRVNSQSRFGGLGLGLYIVKQIVTAHGGTISLESQLEHGTQMTVLLPLN